MKAMWNGTVIAESSDTVEVEGNHYFPEDAIQRKYFRESGTQTNCAWKGTASYYNVEVDGKVNPDAAWYYLAPKAAAAEIKNHVAFWRGIEILE